MAEELSWIRWVLALFVVSLAMAATFYALRRLGGNNKLWLPIRITGRVRLNRSAELMLVEVDNQRFLIGATAGNISKIATLSGEAPSGPSPHREDQHSD